MTMTNFHCASAEEPFGEAPNGAGEAPALPEPANNAIRIHGAREHNLKNISLEIPRDRWSSSPA